MNQLNKWQQELESLSRRAEFETNKKLHKYYRDALKEIKKEVKYYIEQYDELPFSKRMEAERLLDVGKQIDEVLQTVYSKADSVVADFGKEEAKRGYYGTWYALEGAENIQMDMSFLPDKYIEQLVNHPIKGKTFSKRLYDHRNNLAEQVGNTLNYAAIRGKGYAWAAERIGNLTEASYKQAYRIARTEGGRVQSTAKQRSYTEVKEKGVNLKKKWLSTIDNKTRDTHQTLDGQVVEVDEEFESSSGAKAEGPRLFGVASEDIHCRCTTIAEVEGISPELRLDNESGETFDYKNYDEWLDDKIRASKL
ncbi:phage minor head protein [Marinilactibacillus sp. GCM10026970]|uniref:phage minor head protein n=1 Tax=Marinilactibacillus sp. GCM10026970 TaxID=3252642 RepID=UPI003621E3A9